MEPEYRLNDCNEQEAELDTSFNEIFQRVPSTAKMSFYKIIENDEFNIEKINSEWVEWAQKLIQAGYITQRIIKLSQKSTDPSNEIEIIGLTNVIFDELQIDLNDSDTIYKYYGIYIIKEGLINNKDAYEILFQLNLLLLQTCCYIFYDFHLLFIAYIELKTEGEQYYWNGLTFGNKEEYIKEYLEQWIKNPGSKVCNEWEEKSLLRKILNIFFISKLGRFLCITSLIVLLVLLYRACYKMCSDNIPFSICLFTLIISFLIKAILFFIQKK